MKNTENQEYNFFWVKMEIDHLLVHNLSFVRLNGLYFNSQF